MRLRDPSALELSPPRQLVVKKGEGRRGTVRRRSRASAGVLEIAARAESVSRPLMERGERLSNGPGFVLGETWRRFSYTGDERRKVHLELDPGKFSTIAPEGRVLARFGGYRWMRLLGEFIRTGDFGRCNATINCTNGGGYDHHSMEKPDLGAMDLIGAQATAGHVRWWHARHDV